MRNLTPMVKTILQNSQACRNSDRELFIEVMRKMGFNLTDAQEDKFRGINFESIRRTRQKIQEQGLYPADPEIAKSRRIKSMEMEQNMPTAKPERVEQLVQRVPLPWGE